MQLEFNGTNVIAEGERSGKASSLFWPWAGANVSLLALSYGSFFLGFGISFWQATFAAIIGTVLSFLLVGFSSLAGKKSNAPTMVLSRAVFGVKGNVVPGFMSYLVFVGWETVLVSLATLATGTIFMRIGDIDRNLAMVIGFVVAVSLTMYGGVLGHQVIMRLQKYLTLITSFATLIYIVLTFDEVSWDKVSSVPAGNAQAFIGALIFGITGIGLGWVNTAADYSRYLPRNTSSKSVVGWTVLGASIVPIILVIYAILDLYSSGLTLLAIGVPIKRHIAALFDGAIMLVGSIYLVWIADNFFYPFQGFLITLGVPIATWSAIFVTDVLLRKRAYSEADLYKASGKYGSLNKRSLSIMAVGTFIGWGFVTNSFASWLSWQGYLLFIIGGKDGSWAYSNVGVIFALLVGFSGHYLLAARKIRAEEG